MYLLEIQRYKLLTREEERLLAIRAKEKQDKQAAFKLVTSNLRLVVKIAKDFHRYKTTSLLDLIQEGNVGLLQSVGKFDPYRGIKFSYYASFWIKAYILKFVMDNWNLIRIGTTQNQRKLFFNLSKEKENLKAEGVTPDPGLLADRLDVKEKEVVEMGMRMSGSEVSIFSPVEHDIRESLASVLPDPGTAPDEHLSAVQSWKLLSKKLEKCRSSLQGRDADIFDRRIMAEDPQSLSELGKKHHVSRERIRQIQKKIVKNIKDCLCEEIPNFEEEYTTL
jgi:RNA polymerase sigma-32 factor